jgi:hypothetical protein
MIVGYSKQISDYFPEYLVLWDYPNEPRDILTKLEADAAELQRGTDEKNPAFVGHIAKDSAYINFGRNWLCSSCPNESRCTTKPSVTCCTTISYFCLIF